MIPREYKKLIIESVKKAIFIILFIFVLIYGLKIGYDCVVLGTIGPKQILLIAAFVGVGFRGIANELRK